MTGEVVNNKTWTCCSVGTWFKDKSIRCVCLCIHAPSYCKRFKVCIYLMLVSKHKNKWFFPTLWSSMFLYVMVTDYRNCTRKAACHFWLMQQREHNYNFCWVLKNFWLKIYKTFYLVFGCLACNFFTLKFAFLNVI